MKKHHIYIPLLWGGLFAFSAIMSGAYLLAFFIAIAGGIIFVWFKHSEEKERQKREAEWIRQRNQKAGANCTCSKCGKKIALSDVRIRNGRNYCPACARDIDRNEDVRVLQSLHREYEERKKPYLSRFAWVLEEYIERQSSEYECSVCHRRLQVDEVNISGNEYYCAMCLSLKKANNSTNNTSEVSSAEKAQRKEFSFTEALETIPDFLQGGPLIALKDGKIYSCKQLSDGRVELADENGVLYFDLKELDDLYAFRFLFVYKDKEYRVSDCNEKTVKLIGEPSEPGFKAEDGRWEMELPVFSVEKVICERVSIFEKAKNEAGV